MVFNMQLPLWLELQSPAFPPASRLQNLWLPCSVPCSNRQRRQVWYMPCTLELRVSVCPRQQPIALVYSAGLNEPVYRILHVDKPNSSAVLEPMGLVPFEAVTSKPPEIGRKLPLRNNFCLRETREMQRMLPIVARLQLVPTGVLYCSLCVKIIGNSC